MEDINHLNFYNMKKIFLIAALGVAGLASANGVLTTEKTVRGVEVKKEVTLNVPTPVVNGEPVEIRCYDSNGVRVKCPEIIIITVPTEV